MGDQAKSIEALKHSVRAAAAHGFCAVMDDELLVPVRESARKLAQTSLSSDLASVAQRIVEELAHPSQLGRVDRTRIVALAMRLSLTLDAQRRPETTKSRKSSAKPASSRGTARVSRSARSAQAGSSEPAPGEKSGTRSAPIASKAEGRRAPTSVLPGIGPKLAEKLAARGVYDVEDLAHVIPTNYVDHRVSSPLGEVLEGATAVVRGIVRQFRSGWYRGRYMASLRVEQRDGDAAVLDAPVVDARWFHAVQGLFERVTTGQSCTLVGPVKSYRGQPSMVHPEVYFEGQSMPAIGVRYPAIEGVSPKLLRKACVAAVDYLRTSGHADPLPAELRERWQLSGLLDALASLHDPAPDLDPAAVVDLCTGASPGHQRLAFDELFFIQLAFLLDRASWRAAPPAVPALHEGSFGEDALRACLPFEPTQAQWRCIAEIERELALGQPMLRLLQGDVGSGKTVVAFAAAMMCHAVGGQTAIMAPTEILAEQHHRTLLQWCELAGMRVALLTGAMRKAERNSLLALLRDGKVDVLVGTHALLVGDVEFAQLGLVVVDEQHRFGVDQRSALRAKGRAPHLLVMTATPIPRSLALTAHGELEVSLLDELPPGRTPPDTRVFAGSQTLPRARNLVRKSVLKGVQAFVVCPLVEASEFVEGSDVEAAAEEFRRLLPDHGVGVVHGRMTTVEKDAVMARFRAGELHVLVATTVIEVGVDVPAARVILVEHAERFGLAQLHQLRGRVGRGGGASLCLVHTAHGAQSEAGQRLRILAEHQDGFAVAQADLEIRGPGEMFGTRQSGAARLRFAGFGKQGVKNLQRARNAAAELLTDDPHLERRPELLRELRDRDATAAAAMADAG